jgi:glycogen debranching enzyme
MGSFRGAGQRGIRIAVCLLVLLSTALAEQGKSSLALSRPVRTWEFLPVVGTRAALFGNEAGQFEAWVYPLKLFRNFHLNFLVGGQTLPAASLARTIIVHPESSTIVYAGDAFSVKETLFVPVHEEGAIIEFEISTAEPMEVEAVFERDFQLEWPAALGGTYINWDPALHAFSLGEESKKYAALVGSSTAVESRLEYSGNYSSSNENSLRLGVVQPGRRTKQIVIAASSRGYHDAVNIFQRLASSSGDLRRESAEYYRNYLGQTVDLDLPDKQLQQAYDWARISLVQGLVTNPTLGTGLVAGYKYSGEGQRPGFAWYFGRDSMWSSLALAASGDFSTTRTALDFLAKYQRSDGKVPHEISQAADLVPWFTAYPYPYASVDATPLFIIAADDYCTRSGDLSFGREKWDKLWKAYEFLRSTYDPRGFPQNAAFGHGWVEGGPLHPVKAELYQVAVGAAALRALAHIANLIGKDQVSSELTNEFQQQKKLLNQLFWSEEKGAFAFALDANYARMDIPSILASVPMWFELLDEDKAERMIDILAAPELETDWGMRLISSKASQYSPSGYHFGSVWPLFTGWAAVGEYKYHRSLPAYENLRTNALLALDGSLGHITEVLSGDYYEPLSTSSPHQIWSAAMVVSPILRGMLGLDVDATAHTVQFAPHVPADWNAFHIQGLRVGNVRLNLTYQRSGDELLLRIERIGEGDCALDFNPAASLRAKVLRADVDGRPISFHMKETIEDRHIMVHIPIERATMILRIKIRDDFGLALNSELPPLGSESQGLRVISQSWNKERTVLSVSVAGRAGQNYELSARGASQLISVEGAEALKDAQKEASKNDDESKVRLRVSFPPGSNQYETQQIKLMFRSR